jgi:phage gp16-like protein
MLVLLCFMAMPAFAQKAKVNDYATRLAALLSDTQGKANLGPASWKALSNEAVSLANKLYAYSAIQSKARKLAAEVQTHVRAMRHAANSDDAAGAKEHAAEALPYVYQLIDWAQPANPK